MSHVHFRDFIPPQTPDDWRYNVLHGHDPYSHVKALAALDFAKPIIEAWQVLSQQPFVGITSNGTLMPNLYTLQPNGAPTHGMVEAAIHLLAVVSPQERDTLCYPIDARERRLWNNTELVLHAIGLRLEEVSQTVREAIVAVVCASLSAQGFDKVRDVMRLNAFLGDLVQAPRIFNEWSYNFSLFGAPSTVEPWGWSLFGHHLALNCLVLGEQMTLSPLFLGAEPAFADAGPFAGTRLFQDEEKLGLALMQSLPAHLQEQAVVFKQMVDPAMPPGRLNIADQRHLGGAFQDNRIIPYEGARVAEFSARQRQRLLDLIKAFLTPMPTGPLSARLEEIEQHLQDTHFCWIGAHDETSPFYYRIQSPVVMIEYDMHAGIYLTNEQPERFHVHTIIRMPNGNDYGMDLLRLHYQQAHPGHRPGGTSEHGQ
jgi:hypothetical protein